MTAEILLRKQIALSQVPAGDSENHRYGRGFNYTVEAVFPLVNEREGMRALDRVLAEVDHRSLGLDVALGFTPESSLLCQYLFKSLMQAGIRSLSLHRGDGLVFSCYGQP